MNRIQSLCRRLRLFFLRMHAQEVDLEIAFIEFQLQAVEQMRSCVQSIGENPDNPIIVFFACDTLGSLSTRLIVVATLRCLLMGIDAMFRGIDAIFRSSVLEYFIYLTAIFGISIAFLCLAVGFVVLFGRFF